MLRRRRFLHKNVQGGPGQMARAQGFGQSFFVDDAAAGAIDDAAAGFHESQRADADQIAGLVGQRRVHRDKITARQQLLEARDTLDA